MRKIALVFVLMFASASAFAGPILGPSAYSYTNWHDGTTFVSSFSSSSSSSFSSGYGYGYGVGFGNSKPCKKGKCKNPPVSVTEPSALVLLLVGLLGAGLIRKIA